MFIKKDCIFICSACGEESTVTNVCRPVPENMIKNGLAEDYKGHRDAVNMVCVIHNCEWC